MQQQIRAIIVSLYIYKLKDELTWLLYPDPRGMASYKSEA